MKGTILRKGEKSYTRLTKIFFSFNNVQKNYNWLITDCNCYPKNKQFNDLLTKEYCWLSGEQLTEMVHSEDFQWIWSVLSGFEKDIPLEQVLQYELPYADGYTGFWKNPISMQHPLSVIEIVPWDSTLVLVISKIDEIVDNFQNYFPMSEDLLEYNK